MFSIAVGMGWRKQYAKEAEVEVQLEEICETPGQQGHC